MADIPYIAEAAALIGDPARANMLSALEDDGVRSATGLAHVAGVAPNTASGHLAGRLGVRLAEALAQLHFIKHTPDGFALLDRGETAFVTLGIDIDALKAKRRRLVRPCPDWSERQAHLGGALGAELFERFCDLGWLRRQSGTRAVSVTPKGKSALRKHFRMEC
jgi:hypothetical protein